ncbi:rod shape-determining protein RodA [Emticicia sp. 17c]|uniref:rod shape-determining protein RodA n=1 Tax=Emticicia sp. 17c TaxID=3127704 RepID=UPI00301C62D5
MARDIDIREGIDWTTVWLYAALVLFGWLNIYAAVYNPENPIEIISLSHNAGRQLIFIGASFILILIILFVDYKVYDSFAYIFYGLVILLLIGTIFLATEIKGSRSWIKIGTFSFQPAEFSKVFTALALARYLSTQNVNITRFRDAIVAGVMVFLPPVIIILQKETGSALTFAAFVAVFYREGLPGIYPALGIALAILFVVTLFVPNPVFIMIGLAVLCGLFWYLFLKRYERTQQNLIRLVGVFVLASMFVFGTGFFITKVLQPHQQKRIQVLVNPDSDPLGAGWNVTQSRIAISSGGIIGKGYLQGTQTKFDFVPEQSTDFIFCTVGEEWGFVGSLIVILIFAALLNRIINLAEKQRSKFARIYGYCVASILFFHLFVNIGMTIGLMPVIGIPLPFLSYGGSSLWSFTMLLFIFLKLDAHRSYKV